MKKNISQRDIARMLGINVSTVSRALKGDRKHGYLEALRERGMTIRKDLIKCGHVSFNSGLSDTLELLDLPEQPDAILADHGLLAISCYQAIISRGLSIPRDIAIIGFMSDWVSSMSYPHIRESTKK